MFDFLRKIVFYDKKYCEKAISKYTGTKSMQILRALSSGALKPNDIKKYYNYGWSGCPSDEEYVLINSLSNNRNYAIKRYESGSNFSMLKRIELKITNGYGVITEYWVCA